MNFGHIRKVAAFFFLLAGLSAHKISFGQEVEATQTQSDSSVLQSVFRKGKFEGRFRLYYMATDNAKPLTDYYALAFGGGLKYETRQFKGFQLGVGGFFIWNLISSDLTKPDSITGVMNRYEIGQFDQTNPSNKKDLQRLEDFYIKYNYKNSFLKFGKQVINTPFINPQDGRMRPTGEQGFWAEVNELKKLKLETGWLTHISPRGTLKWYRGASSVGIYPSGVNIYGEKSGYKNNLNSKGIAIAGLNYKVNDDFNIQAWNYWVENIFNTVFIQADKKFPSGEKGKFITGMQYIRQDAVHYGGNSDIPKTYFDPSQHADIFSWRAGYQYNNSTARLNYTRITNSGRFLFPREWGREPLYTFMPRERNEGLGDVNAYTLNLLHQFQKPKLSIDVSYGYYDVAGIQNYRLNKYGFPSYHQFNFDIRHSFSGSMKGLSAQLLYVYKRKAANTFDELKYEINKVGMNQLNLVLNFVY